MNHRTASAITFTTTVAAATVAAAFLSSNAYAESPTIDTTVFVSTRSRAEVQAELMSRPDQISAAGTEWALQQNQPRPFQSGYTVEQVRSEYKAARNEVRMMTGEDSGSSYLAQLPRSGHTSTIVARSAH
jgi:hypothetical protein